MRNVQDFVPSISVYKQHLLLFFLPHWSSYYTLPIKVNLRKQIETWPDYHAADWVYYPVISDGPNLWLLSSEIIVPLVINHRLTIYVTTLLVSHQSVLWECETEHSIFLVTKVDILLPPGCKIMGTIVISLADCNSSNYYIRLRITKWDIG